MSAGRAWDWGVAAVVVAGALLVADSALRSSATYDEVAYLEIGADWWRHGRQERIARMGSPLTFWKLQQAPVLWALDRAGFGRLIDEPIRNQAALLPLVRLGSLWIWAIALLVTAGWAGRGFGPQARLVAAALFALSPNLIAHGGLITMEMPLVAATAGVLLVFSRHLEHGGWGAFVAAGALAGLAFSCKFTAILLPPLLVAAWTWERWSRGDGAGPILRGAAGRLAAFLGVMALANLVVTGGARIPLSERQGDHPALERMLGPGQSQWIRVLSETPLPQDGVAFLRQLQHQRGGGPSYLLGERRLTGWWYYYLVCLLVKLPLSLWLLIAGWMALRLPRIRSWSPAERLAATLIAGALVITAAGSSRNYGFRYLLFLAPACLLLLTSLARAGRRGWALLLVGLAGQALAVAWIHPAELAFFHRAVGGPEGGKFVLSDSNLDWGQGARALARLQAERPELKNLTLLAFGDTDPGHYGVVGTRYLIDAHGPRGAFPERLAPATPFVAVGRSLQFGPWGPPGYFRALDAHQPVAVTADHTIAVYAWPPGSGGPAAGEIRPAGPRDRR
jgi:4-amino-4-deoxy-L-arabinose transferase-like glycosyltransferase